MVALGERSTPNGQELLAEFIQYGHQKPFEEIVRRYAGMVFNVCYRITKDKHEAEDATQAVFLTLALQAKRGADIKALGPWLQQVGKRLALDTRRSKKRRLNREERHHTEQSIRRESLLDDALPSADLDELKTILHEELQKLPAKYRMPLILHYFGGLSRDEMAAELNCKASTLGVRIFRGREMLAGRLSSRGIHISTSMLAVLLGYAVKRAVSESLIATTSHAATAMLAGHDGAGYASAHVIGLTRRAGSAMAIGKVKMAAITLLLAGTSLGAGAKALGILPQIDVKQMITNQLKRMVSPLMNPFGVPSLRVDSQTASPSTTVATAPAPAVDPPIYLAKAIAHSTPSINPALNTPAAIATTALNNGSIIKVAGTPTRSAWTDSQASAHHFVESSPVVTTATVDRSTGTLAKSGDDDAAISASASGGGGGAGGGSGGIAAAYHPSDPLPSKATAQSLFKPSEITFTSRDLVVGSIASRTGGVAHSTSGSSSTLADPVATPAALIQIPAINGSVTESSSGVVRGYGTIDRTGTLVMVGKTVADGQGIDRTLNLSSFSALVTSVAGTTPASAPSTPAITSAAISAPVAAAGSTIAMAGSVVSASLPTIMDPAVGVVAAVNNIASTGGCKDAPAGDDLDARGWYAINHGRLTFPLMASTTDSSTLTWGDDPNAAALSLVNSVRIKLNTTDPVPAALSLLASNRSDVPNLLQITGQTIGLWQVDPNGPDLSSVDLSIRYNSVLADELGASSSSVELWTYGSDASSWQLVDPASFSLDATDHIVSGSASDVSFFAVSVQPTVGRNVDDLIANHLAQFSGGTGGSSQSVPEPVALPLLVLGASALLGRRRRRN